jgi:hypothetical protein
MRGEKRGEIRYRYIYVCFHPRTHPVGYPANGTTDREGLMTQNRKRQTRKAVTKTTDWTTLKGKFFHTFDEDGYVKYQGQIVDLVGDEIAIVQYYDWVVGAPNLHKAVWVSDVVDGAWALYGNPESWNEAFEIHLVKPRPVE